MISWITENVAIGDYKDARNVEMLVKERIDCILDLRRYHGIEIEIIEETEDLCAKEGCFPHHYHMKVGSYKGLEPIKIELRTAAYMLDLLSEKYKRILVHCTAGIDRAPFVVAYYLASKDDKIDRIMEINSEDFRFWIIRAYKFIKEKRPQIIEHMEWI